MDKKRTEGKPYRVYMMASANKFLRIYYATVKQYLDSPEVSVNLPVQVSPLPGEPLATG